MTRKKHLNISLQKSPPDPTKKKMTIKKNIQTLAYRNPLLDPPKTMTSKKNIQTLSYRNFLLNGLHMTPFKLAEPLILNQNSSNLSSHQKKK